MAAVGRVREKIGAEHQGAGGEDGAEEAAAVDCEQFDRDARAGMFLVGLAGQARDFGHGLRSGQHGRRGWQRYSGFWFSGAGKLVP